METKIKIIDYTPDINIGAVLRGGSRKQEESAEKSSREIVERIREEGDSAVISYLKKFDNFECTADKLHVSEKEYEEAERAIGPELAEAMEVAISNVKKFHQAQRVPDIEVETMPGVVCRQKSVPVERVGLYIPGGTAPLFSTVIMLAVPAKIAGCKRVIMCSPVNKNGVIAPEVLYCAKRCGVDKVYKIGGATAIGAMAFGTEHVEKVDKIFGPGNSYVTAAKQYVSKAVCAIDMPAGPSEVMILADESANPEFVTADFISQLEHGPESQAVLVTASRALAEKVSKLFTGQVTELGRKGYILESAKNSSIVIVPQKKMLSEVANIYAPEHLIIATEDCDAVAEEITNAGSIFIGNYTPESAGDYASGTNHTLPTGGWAVSYSGVNLSSFVKRITLQKISPEGLLKLAPSIETMAAAEGLDGHKRAAGIRVESIRKNK